LLKLINTNNNNMKKRYLKSLLILLMIAFVVSCTSSDDDSNTTSAVTKEAVIANYAAIAYANYKQAYDDAVILETAINTFTDEPTQENFDNAKDKWKQSRESYGTTEAFRFANGPIDDENGPESLLNAWPLDENFIDYVEGASTSGIINDPDTYPTIDKEFLEEQNENGGEKNISVGYHAIEFLLWGQDLTAPSEEQAGLRQYTDYVVDGGTASNEVRRATYLKVCADLLTDHLDYMVSQWAVGGDYRTVFLALDEDVALQNMYLGITTLVSAELPVERMYVALGNADQEDEHSCFSDNTHRDIILNLEGVINVYQGKYGTIDGASLEDLVQQADATTYADTDEAVTDTVALVDAILTPFDLAISGGIDSTEGAKVYAAVVALKNLGANLLAGASKLGIVVNG
jgi:putative iron-regulated protein